MSRANTVVVTNGRYLVDLSAREFLLTVNGLVRELHALTASDARCSLELISVLGGLLEGMQQKYEQAAGEWRAEAQLTDLQMQGSDKNIIN